jgi:hypothetical protein
MSPRTISREPRALKSDRARSRSRADHGPYSLPGIDQISGIFGFRCTGGLAVVMSA